MFLVVLFCFCLDSRHWCRVPSHSASLTGQLSSWRSRRPNQSHLMRATDPPLRLGQCAHSVSNYECGRFETANLNFEKVITTNEPIDSIAWLMKTTRSYTWRTFYNPDYLRKFYVCVETLQIIPKPYRRPNEKRVESFSRHHGCKGP